MGDLASDFLTWLDKLVLTAGAAGVSSPAEITQRLIYVVVPIRDDPRMPQLGVKPFLAKRRKDGSVSLNSRPYLARHIRRDGAGWVVSVA